MSRIIPAKPKNRIIAAGSFNGTTGAALEANNLSITRNSAGNYSATFGTAEPDTNYIVNVTPAGNASFEIVVNMNRASNGGRQAPTTSGFRFVCVNNGGNTEIDAEELYVTVTRAG